MSTFRKPNLNGPRFKERRISILTVSRLKKFKKKFPEHKHIELSDYKNIIKTFNLLIVENIISNRNGVELPNGLGCIFIGSCPKPKKENINFAESVKLGMKVTYKNWDSDNKLMKIFYTNHNTKYPLSNKKVWMFKPVKQFRKKASDNYKENWAKYVDISPNEKISAMFDRHRSKERIKNMKPIIPDGYDEFDV